MKKLFVSLLEYGFLLAGAVLLVAFVGLPPPMDNRIAQLAGPAIPSLTQGVERWDETLQLPLESDRIANYRMDVKLNPQTNVVSGWEILEWKNTTGRAQQSFPFHLYHNAWKNNRSTYVRENNYQFGRTDMKEEDLGYTNVGSVRLIEGTTEIDISSTFEYIQPDDGNRDDQTVFQITTPKPVPPGGTMKLKIEFETKQPIPLRRTGTLRNYHFVVQWFPKIGVWWNNAWSCHQFHYNTEFFSDYGVYDVTITVPSSYILGATGGFPREERENNDGTKTARFHQADVHDFAWLTSPDLVRSIRKFVHNDMETGERPDRHHPLREVTVILLTQPHHAGLIDRYFDATFKALRYYGEWYGEYPYETVTVVDPANDSRSGGMEYPTLFTGGGNMYAPKEQPSPESVTVHEFGHQFWFGLIGNNEFEEAWLDEGFNSYSQDRVLNEAWKPFKAVRYFFGGPGAGTYVGVPYVFHEVNQSRYGAGNNELQRMGKHDVMARNGWEYYQSYGLNSYTKPAMSLITLERYLGEETMYRVMRTYHHRFRFKHPTTQDFIGTVNEVSGQDMSWFFRNTWFSSNLFDYALDRITNREVPKPFGLFDWNGMRKDEAPPASVGQQYECEVVVKREGEAVAPVDVLIVFKNGEQRREQWDGEYRWKKYTYLSDSPVEYAIVDPDVKLVMDINYTNNSKVVRENGFRSLAARKYAAKWMFWAQNYFEMISF